FSTLPVENPPPRQCDAILASDLSVALTPLTPLRPELKRHSFGPHCQRVASAHWLIASPFKSAYVAAKPGLVGLAQVVALEAAEHRITCNAVCAGYGWAPLVESQIEA